VISKLLILGCGYTGSRVLEQALARGLEVIATVRSEASAIGPRAIAARFAPGAGRTIVAPVLTREVVAPLGADTHVVVAFPSDGHTDATVAPWLAGAHSVAYISSTGVYGDVRGRIDDSTPLPPASDERGRRLRDAEAQYLAIGATVLRSPGIYGPDRGLHMRILRGEHRIPGDGSRFTSRIHAEDLAQLTLAAAGVRNETFVVGDECPARHIEVVRYICELHGLPLPAHVPLDSVHASLRADRAVDASRALATLNIKLRYPSYREGLVP
jgi:nucleoside-diphosphate-sugar epimerase